MLHAKLESLASLPTEYLDDMDMESVLSVKIRSDSRGYLAASANRWALYTLKEQRRKLSLNKIPQYRDLQILLCQPLDIIYEVFGHLHPLDLYHFSGTAKSLRELVMPRGATRLWKDVFLRNPSVPRCPSDVPEPKWADLLFGPFICQSCDSDVTYRDVHWKTRRRLCQDCCGILYENTLTNEPDSKTPLLLTSIQCLAERLEFLEYMISWKQSRIHRIELENLKSDPTTSDLVIHLLSHHEVCVEWANHLSLGLKVDAKQPFRMFRSIIENRLVKRGHSLVDIRSVLPHYGPYHDPPSILAEMGLGNRHPARTFRRDWPKIIDLLEPRITKVKYARMATVRKNLLSKRKAIIYDRYNQYQKSIADNFLAFTDDFLDSLPPGPELVIYEPFSTMLNAPSDVEIQVSDLSSEIPKFIERWPPRTMYDLGTIYASISEGLRQTASLGLGTCNIDTVTCVFSCPGCARELGAISPGSYLFGWSAVAIHRVCPRLGPGEPMTINERACTAISSLLAVLGLDQRTTQSQQLDELEPALMCVACPAEREPGLFSWREFVAHSLEMEDEGSHTPSIWRGTEDGHESHFMV